MKQLEKLDAVTVRTDTAREGDLTLRYTLFYKENPHAPYRRAPLYSVRAEILRENDEVEACELIDTFADPGHALIFYELCRTHRVFPVHLRNIREEFEG